MTGHWIGTVADVLGVGRPDLPHGPWLYIARVPEAVLYVGRSVRPVKRLREHFTPPNCIAHHGGPLTALAQDNWGDAQGWELEIRRADDDVRAAETALIGELRPCLNVVHYVGGSPRIPRRLLTNYRNGDAFLALYDELDSAALS